MQFRLAEKSATMAIFLGKQILGQKDNVDLNVNKKEDIGVEIKSLSVHAIKALLKEGRKVVDVTDSVPDYLAELPTSELLQMLNTATKGEADGADKSENKNQGEIETISPDSVVKGTDTEDGWWDERNERVFNVRRADNKQISDRVVWSRWIRTSSVR